MNDWWKFWEQLLKAILLWIVHHRHPKRRLRRVSALLIQVHGADPIATVDFHLVSRDTIARVDYRLVEAKE